MTRDVRQAYNAPSGSDAGTAELPKLDQQSEETPPSQKRTALEIRTSDREELIQYIKQGQRPTWVPKPGLEALCVEANSEHAGSSDPSRSEHELWYATHHIASHHHEAPLSVLAPPALATDALRRSMSALHTGNFHEPALSSAHQAATISTLEGQLHHFREDTESSKWSSPFPGTSISPTSRHSHPNPSRRPRAPSLGSSLSSSFVMRVPTSPLVHAMNNSSADFSPDDRGKETHKYARRRTMPPSAFESFRMSPIEDAMPNMNHSSAQTTDQLNSSSSPTRHKPHRSLNSFTYQPTTSPQTPFRAGSRRRSLASDGSPRLRASMVGSFEESILRGRMSTPASKPFDFVAQIGVIGKGKCPPSLKCPAHVTVPFPAVFYSYPSASGSRSISDDNPSPYVGTIDLAQNLKPAEFPARHNRKSKIDLDREALVSETASPESTNLGLALAREIHEEKIKMKQAPAKKGPHGGVYRVPQAGQLQIIIRNPNKTAVKLFLVPYDLDGMLPGTKTFVRQRSFSSGPALEAFVMDKQATTTGQDCSPNNNSNKDILRYLVHLKFCCTSKNRFYLYENIRVVFANRVPDDKEQLRNELQVPEPRFSPYKTPADSGSRSPSITHETSSHLQHILSQREPSQGVPDSKLAGLGGLSQSPFELQFSSVSVAGVQLSGTFGAHDEDELSEETACTLSPVPGFLPSTSSRSSPVPWSATRPSHMVEAGDGLLSRKLRALNGSTSGNSEQEIRQ